jgi:ribosomal protein S18 acetylase RimI-like enzyme
MAPGKPWWAKKTNDPRRKTVQREITGIKGKDGMLNIRTFDFARDFPAVIELWANAGPGIHLRRSDEAGEIQKKIQRDPDLFLVAEIEAKIVGAVLGGFDGRRGMIYHLAVKEDLRKQGIAAQLMDELENRLQAKGCIRSYLLVTSDNFEAIRFYEAHNWKRMELLTYGKDLG